MKPTISRARVARLAAFSVILLALLAGPMIARGQVAVPDLRATQATLDSCQNDAVHVSFVTAYRHAGNLAGYMVKTVQLDHIAAACAGQTVSLTLIDGQGERLATVGAPILGANGDRLRLDLGNTMVLASTVNRVGVSIASDTSTSSRP